MSTRTVPPVPSSQRDVGDANKGDRTAVRAAVVLAGVIVLVVGVPAFLSVLTGSWWIPHNDDWAFTRIAEEFARSGQVRLPGWNNTGVLGQALALGPLSGNATARHLLVITSAVLAIIGTYALLVVRVSRPMALLGAATLGVTWSFGLLASSFMTDLPALSAIVLCLVLGELAMRRGSPVILGIALLVGIWGATIREQAIFAPALVVLVAVLQRGNVRLTRAALWFGVAAAGLFLWYESWRRGLPDAMNPIAEVSLMSGLEIVVRIYFTVALMLLPALVVAIRPQKWRLHARIAGLMIVLPGFALTMARHPVVLGNYLDRHGAYAAASIGTRSVLPEPLFWMVMLAAVIAGVFLMGHLLSTWRQVDRRAWLYAAVSLTVASIPAFLGQGTFSRYLLPVLVTGLLVVLQPTHAGQGATHVSQFRRQTFRATVAGATLLVGWALSLLLTSNALAYDAARWRMAEALVSRGVPTYDVDAGLEWDGTHAQTPAKRGEPGHADALYWGIGLFSESRECYVVSGAPIEGLPEIERGTYRTFAIAGHSEIWVYQVTPCR